MVQGIAEREGWGSWKVPHLRTIQRIVARTRPADSSGVWEIEDSSPDDARVVLDFLADAIAGTNGRVSEITREQAAWIIRLRKLGPPMEFDEILRLAALYRDRRTNGNATRDLDAFLAFAPWRDKPAAIRYLRAVLNELIEAVPQWLAEKAPTLEWFTFSVIAGGDADPWGPQTWGILSYPSEGASALLMPADALAYLDELEEELNGGA